MFEDISIADDFDVRLGVVSGGVSLSIRPAETKPKLPDIFHMDDICGIGRGHLRGAGVGGEPIYVELKSGWRGDSPANRTGGA
jgi:hypothetical protein